jgi:acyl carrier protein
VGHQTDGAVVGQLVGIVSSVVGIPADEVPTDVSFWDGLNIDSLGMVEVVLAVESRFQVRIPDAKVGQFADGSIEDAANWIRNERRSQNSH